MQYENTDPSGREQKTSLLLDAPVAVVWEAFTNPEHIKHWWGPNGFTNTIEKMDVTNGGEWLFVMHGPDGNDYPNKTVFREVIPHQKLVHEHFEPNFIAIIEFESKGNKTAVHWYKLYETKELHELVEVRHKSSEGFKQTVERLKQYLSAKPKKRPQENTWKYVLWAFVGGVVVGVPFAVLASLTGLKILSPIGAAGGAAVFMMNRINNDRKKTNH